MAEIRVADENEQNVHMAPRKVFEDRVTGVVKWFNVKAGYGFIHRADTESDIFVHHSAITGKKSGNIQASLRDREEVEFYVVEGDKGDEASEVTGPNGALVLGSVYASRDRWRGSRGFHMQGRGREFEIPGYGDYYSHGPPRGRPGMFGGGGGRGRPFRGRGRPRGYGFRGGFEPRGRDRQSRNEDQNHNDE